MPQKEDRRAAAACPTPEAGSTYGNLDCGAEHDRKGPVRYAELDINQRNNFRRGADCWIGSGSGITDRHTGRVDNVHHYGDRTWR